MEFEGQVQMHRKEGGEGGRHRYGTRRRCVKTGDREAEGGGVSMQWASPPCCNTPRLEEALQHITMATAQESQVVDSAVHNALFVQYLLLATEQVGSYFKSCVLVYHLTYIYPNSFGCEQNSL